MRRLAIFDVDGTLVDSQGHIHAAMGETFAAAGLPEPDRAAVRSIIGLSLPVAIARLAGRPAPDLVEPYKAAYVGLAATAGSAEAAPLFPGALEALAALEARGIVLGIATGKSRRGGAPGGSPRCSRPMGSRGASRRCRWPTTTPQSPTPR